MADSIQQFRDQGNFKQAVDVLLKICCSQKAPQQPELLNKVLLQHLARRCLILEWASDCFAKNQRQACLGTLDQLSLIIQPLLGPLAGQFAARLALIRAAAVNSKGSDLQQAVLDHVAAVNSAWQYEATDYIKDLQKTDFAPTPQDARCGPSFLWNLEPSVRLMLQELAGNHGWLHPGLLLAGESLAMLEGKRSAGDHKVINWVMFACESGSDCFGVLARLEVERIPLGRGFLIPDALVGGYYAMADTFSMGLQNALYAAWITSGSYPKCDYRWHIAINHALQKSPLESVIGVPMSGRSAEGAITCALRAALRGEELDRNTSMSAKLAKPIEKSLALEAVEGLDIKCLVPNSLINHLAFQKRLKSRQIHAIIVSDKHSDLELDTGSRDNFIQVQNIEQAEQHFHVWPTITRAVKAGICKRATADRIALCGPEPADKDIRRREGCSYVQSPVAMRPIRQSLSDEKLIPLDSAATRRFVLGRWQPPNANPNDSIRVRLFADSGMGKSVQLVVCEQEIAKRADLMIPIRIGKSSNHRTELKGQTSIATVHWHNKPEEVLASLAQACLVEFIPKEYRDKTVDWMIRKAENGELVFLIDALDQTSIDLEQLAKFLMRYPACPSIAAGRPESAQTRESLFGQQTWETLELQEFGARQQKRLLGLPLAKDLLLAEDEQDEGGVHFLTPAEVVRKHHWQELLKVPLLIQLLKRLARSTHGNSAALDGIRNRYELYQRAVGELLDKGLKTIAGQSQLTVASKRDWTIRQLRHAALKMVGAHNFDSLEGAAFVDWCNEIGDKGIEDLVQADIVTMHGLLDRMTTVAVDDPTKKLEPGIEWRHRSFLEYFAGLELADRWRSPDPAVRQTVSAVLLDVHACLDERGNHRTWPVWDPERNEYVQRFRNLQADWNWTLRFALSEARDESRDLLALRLIELGNPWVVYESIARDHTPFSREVECVACWLVHRDWRFVFDYTSAVSKFMERWKSGNVELTTDEVRLTATSAFKSRVEIGDLTQRTTRDAAYLSSLRELLPSGARFYVDLSAEQRLAERLERLSGKSGEWDFTRSFVEIEGGEFDLSVYPEHKSIRPQQITIGNLALADFPVTNELFELFCPSHRHFRDEYSSEDDQPAIWVSHFMAVEFCDWLSAITGKTYCLPSEWEWEWSCRWRNTRRGEYWWGDEMRDDLCWYGAHENEGSAESLRRTRSRSEAIDAYKNVVPQHRHPSWRSSTEPGLLDVLGNVCEWCQNLYAEGGSVRVRRGGSWFHSARDCRSGYRRWLSPGNRGLDLGFRVALVPSSKSSKQSPVT